MKHGKQKPTATDRLRGAVRDYIKKIKVDLQSQFRKKCTQKNTTAVKSRNLPGSDPSHFKDLDTPSTLLIGKTPQPIVFS